MALKPDAGVLAGLAVGTVVFAIHSNATPPQADIQALPAGTPDIDVAERKATWISAGVVAGISLLAKDPTIFLIGSAATIAMALWTRNSNWAESVGGRYLSPSEAAQAGTGSTGPAPVETEAYEMFQGNDSGFNR
ncbi:hypothetical protein GTY62_15255 [Streptomyces sp. SID724]|uniref:hypothetical protein n=1 Tax=Streptomyces sp. SID724 TaxID=2690324 RepID=UPI001360FBAB|nr:hypothetical protein [Streptomyces sp. SID724]